MPENDRLTIGDSVRFESFRPQATVMSPPEAVSVPSLKGVSRANWERTEFLLPVDGTAHHPIYARRVRLADRAARQEGLNPTATNSLDLYNGSEMEQEFEAADNAWRAFTDLVLWIPRMVAWRPWQTRESPDEAYQRYWHPERPEVEPINGVQSVTP
jgi:hypothetical protein